MESQGLEVLGLIAELHPEWMLAVHQRLDDCPRLESEKDTRDSMVGQRYAEILRSVCMLEDLEGWHRNRFGFLAKDLRGNRVLHEVVWSTGVAYQCR